MEASAGSVHTNFCDDAKKTHPFGRPATDTASHVLPSAPAMSAHSLRETIASHAPPLPTTSKESVGASVGIVVGELVAPTSVGAFVGNVVGARVLSQ